MSLNVNQFRTYIIQHSLHEMAEDETFLGEAAENLLLGTALVESRLEYLRQLGHGPALGVYQMEPATHDDIWDNWLAHRPHVARYIGDKNHLKLIYDLKYATKMARIHYYRVPAPLPDADDLRGMADYWKQYYNTPLGKGTPEKYIQAWRSISKAKIDWVSPLATSEPIAQAGAIR